MIEPNSFSKITMNTMVCDWPLKYHIFAWLYHVKHNLGQVGPESMKKLNKNKQKIIYQQLTLYDMLCSTDLDNKSPSIQNGTLHLNNISEILVSRIFVSGDKFVGSNCLGSNLPKNTTMASNTLKIREVVVTDAQSDQSDSKYLETTFNDFKDKVSDALIYYKSSEISNIQALECSGTRLMFSVVTNASTYSYAVESLGGIINTFITQFNFPIRKRNSVVGSVKRNDQLLQLLFNVEFDEIDAEGINDIESSISNSKSENTLAFTYRTPQNKILNCKILQNPVQVPSLNENNTQISENEVQLYYLGQFVVIEDESTSKIRNQLCKRIISDVPKQISAPEDDNKSEKMVNLVKRKDEETKRYERIRTNALKGANSQARIQSIDTAHQYITQAWDKEMNALLKERQNAIIGQQEDDEDDYDYNNIVQVVRNPNEHDSDDQSQEVAYDHDTQEENEDFDNSDFDYINKSNNNNKKLNIGTKDIYDNSRNYNDMYNKNIKTNNSMYSNNSKNYNNMYGINNNNDMYKNSRSNYNNESKSANERITKSKNSGSYET